MYSNIYFNFIQFQLYTGTSLARKKKLTLAWIEILTCKKSIEWNADKFIIYLIGIITKCAFYYDPESFFGIGEVVENLYKVSSGKFKKFKEKKIYSLFQAQFLAWKESMKGPFSWFSSHLHPLIIASNLLHVSPWASFLFLRVEPMFFTAFYEFLDNSLCKHPQRTLEEALKVQQQFLIFFNKIFKVTKI